MSMVTQRSVQCYARGSFPFTAFLEIALSMQRVCVLQMQSRQYLSPLLTKKWTIYYHVQVVVYFTTCVAGVPITIPCKSKQIAFLWKF